MDRETVIKGFECCHIMVHDMGPDQSSCGICPYKDVQTQEQIDLGGIECIAALHDDAIALLREQDAVEPRYNARTNWYECGACHYSMTSGMHCRSELIPAYKVGFCAKCGRQVKWE